MTHGDPTGQPPTHGADRVMIVSATEQNRRHGGQARDECSGRSVLTAGCPFAASSTRVRDPMHRYQSSAGRPTRLGLKFNKYNFLVARVTAVYSHRKYSVSIMSSVR